MAVKQAYNLGGGGTIMKKFKIGATFANAGTITIVDSFNDYGEVIPCTTTSFADTYGVAIDTGTYTTTQSASMVEGVVTVAVNPDIVWKAKMSGGATAGTALTSLVTTTASAGGTTVTDADVGTAAMVGGYVWCSSGSNVGLSRIITTHNSATSVVATVPFPFAIATTDVYHICPWSKNGSNGSGNLQVTSDFMEANAAIASGTGGEVAIVECELNGPTDSYVLFVLADHVLRVNTV